MVGGQLDLDDLAQSLEEVVKHEKHRLSGEEKAWLAERYYRDNEPLLTCHLRAARIINQAGLPVSAKFLTNFARYMTKYPTVAHALVDLYCGVAVKAGEDFKIPDFTTPWLSRYLAKQGCMVKMARSDMDGAL